MCKYCKRLEEVRNCERRSNERMVDHLKRHIHRCDLVLQTAVDELQDISATLNVDGIDEEVYDCICRIDNLIDQLYALYKHDVI